MIISCEDSAVIASGTKKRKSQIYSTEMELEFRNEVILSSLELPYDEDGDFDLCRHESNCLGILRIVFQPEENVKMDTSDSNLWHFVQHYLSPDFPPFMRFLESPMDQNMKYKITEKPIISPIKRMRYTKAPTKTKDICFYEKRNKGIDNEEILRACLKFLSLNTEYFRQIWPWYKFVDIFDDLLTKANEVSSKKERVENKSNAKCLKPYILSNNAKWLAIECVSRLLPNLVEKKRAYLFSRLLEGTNASVNEVQAYASFATEELTSSKANFSHNKGQSNQNPFINTNQNDKSDTRIVNIEKEVLLKSNSQEFHQRNKKGTPFCSGNAVPFVNVYQDDDLLSRIARAVNHGKTILVRGPIGSGKTRIIHHIAEKTNRHENGIYQVNMSDQLDGRSMIGGYSCRDVPGQFQWEDGVATKAVENGKWLIIEDADQAFRNGIGSDGGIAGILLTLIERKQLHIPSRGTVLDAAPGFQLFLTQRIEANDNLKAGSEDALLTAIARTKCNVELFTLHTHSQNQLKMIAEKEPLFKLTNPLINNMGSLNSLLIKMVKCFVALTERSMTASGQIVFTEPQKRIFSLRDFLKWCRRCFATRSPLTSEFIVLEAMDCFTNHLPSNSMEKYERVHGIGRMFGLITNQIDHLIHLRTPTLKVLASKSKPITDMDNGDVEKDYSVIRKREKNGVLTVGRATLETFISLDGTDALNPDFNLKPFFLTPSAAKLLEFVTASIQGSRQKLAENVLLVGETGVGKTSVVQHLASLVGKKLVTVNFNQQTESADLLGGYKPVNFEHFIKPLREKFEKLFFQTFSMGDNAKFISHLSTCYASKRWEDLLKLMLHATKNAKSKCESDNDIKIEWNIVENKLDRLLRNLSILRSGDDTIGSKLLFSFVNGVLAEAAKNGNWILLDEVNMAEVEVLECLSEIMNVESKYFTVSSSFGDVDDDIILKNPNFRVFACMNPATDVGKKQLPQALRNRFTEFFVEEPATKEELLPIVNDYLKRLNDFSDDTKKLCSRIVKFYFEIKQLAEKILVDGIGHKPTYSLRTLCRALTVAIVNISSSSIVTPDCQTHGAGGSYKTVLRRFLLEGFLMCFLTELDRSSYPIVLELIFKHIAGDEKKAKLLLSSELPKPKHKQSVAKSYINIEGFWISCGNDGIEPVVNEKFILTKTVRQNLRDVSRIVSLSDHAVLLQGETSVGKTSLISYLGEATGNQVVRINNHEHTDIQEYVGSYAVDPKTGCFTFVEGALARAMRNGHWVILDELNLAPSDVLEALNRVLDDNRELFIAETQTTIKASGNFRIFATQNPSGKYGGRKTLSRAFRNRFIELHFGELPHDEISTIIEQHCRISPKDSKKLVAVARELKRSRIQNGGGGCDPNMLMEKGFTLRDLFRWANRCHSSQQLTTFYNWDYHFAHEGYLVLASKIRRPQEMLLVIQILEKHFKCKINSESMFDLSIDPIQYRKSEVNSKQPIVTMDAIQSILSAQKDLSTEIIWTKSAIRLAVLIMHSLKFKEPVLMVGETGCGKTSIVAIIAKIMQLTLQTVNCHLNSETSDFLGALRPKRRDDLSETSAPFEWVDGPLVEVMKKGGLFLVDEISLADDSVLERMNSVLEPSRSLTLVEGGSMEDNNGIIQENWYRVVADDTFHFIATMNPGGDFGKKELSPALRNRLVEIWCPSPIEIEADVSMLINQKVLPSSENLFFQEQQRSTVISTMLKFIQWFQHSKTILGDRAVFTVRDLISVVSFINHYIKSTDRALLQLECSFVHGICLVFFDGLASFIETKSKLDSVKQEAKCFLQTHLSSGTHNIHCDCYKWITYDGGNNTLDNTTRSIKVGNFELAKNIQKLNDEAHNKLYHQFSLTSKTVSCNMLKVLRAMQINNKPILLEGAPGVGKTSLVVTLAQITGNSLVRINLSDQTEISDLFGADLPSACTGPNGMASFSWQDGPFLSALKLGHWILLDELNLATQSVLEGLNAALDHRGEIYIPELNRTFYISNEGSKNNSKVFACQNPPRDGGERKNLPKSFLNRFTKVYLNDYTSTDIVEICKHRFFYEENDQNHNMLQQIVAYVEELLSDLNGKSNEHWGSIGGPWQFNLRDILRWCIAVDSNKEKVVAKDENHKESQDIMQFKSIYTKLRLAKLIFSERFRTSRDRTIAIEKLRKHVLPNENELNLEVLFSEESCQSLSITHDDIRIGLAHDARSNKHSQISWQRGMEIKPHERPILESLLFCIKYRWMPILVEENQTGRAGNLINNLSKLYGQPIRVISLNPSSDTSELLGGFEQTGKMEKVAKFFNEALNQLNTHLEICFQEGKSAALIFLIIKVQMFLQNQMAYAENEHKELQSASQAENTSINSSYKFAIQNNLQYFIDSLRSNNHDCKEVEYFLEETKSYFTDSLNEKDESNNAQFSWVESVLVNAMQNGEWLLIEDANRCNPSVLDRLNGLLEENGILEIGEKGCAENGKVSFI